MSNNDADSNESSGIVCPTCGDEFDTKRGRSIHHAHVHGEKLRATLTCPVCEEDFDVRWSQRKSRVCCSHDCYSDLRKERESLQKENSNLWKGGKVTLTCEQCDGEYDVYQCREDTSRFCSRDCEAEWQSENLVGEKAPNYKGGVSPYGSGWTQKKKREVREEYGNKCVSCGMSQEEHKEEFGKRLEVHHLEKAKYIESDEERNSKENLIPLCYTCHQLKWELMAPLRPQINE